MNASEIVLMFFLFATGLMVTEYIVSHFIYFGAFKRLILRIMFLIQYSLLIYYFFDSRAKAKKNNQDEKNETESEEITFKKNGDK